MLGVSPDRSASEVGFQSCVFGQIFSKCIKILDRTETWNPLSHFSRACFFMRGGTDQKDEVESVDRGFCPF